MARLTNKEKLKMRLQNKKDRKAIWFRQTCSALSGILRVKNPEISNSLESIKTARELIKPNWKKLVKQIEELEKEANFKFGNHAVVEKMLLELSELQSTKYI